MKKLLFLVLLAVPLAACTTTSRQSTGFDELADYDAVMIAPVSVSFDADWEPKTSESRISLDERGLERVRKNVAEVFDQRLRYIFEREGIRIVDQAGPRVLSLKPELRDVWLYAPDPESVFGTILIRRVGSMQLYIEFRDSVSDEGLIVLQDYKQGRDRGYLQPASKTKNRFLLNEMFDEWAIVIAEDLLGPGYKSD